MVRGELINQKGASENRERLPFCRQDIPALVEHFIGHYSAEHCKPVRAITPDALDTLVKYAFPGNVRELGNILEQAIVLSRGEAVTLRDLPPSVLNGHSEPSCPVELTGSLEDQVAILERSSLDRAMRETVGNKSAAARLLGISERKIRYMLKKYRGEE